MLETLRRAFETEPCVTNALVFGSRARGTAHSQSDVDVAVELIAGAARDAVALGSLTARLESAVQHTVNLVLLDEAPPRLAYRIFRDGHLLLERDHALLAGRKARAILDYLDFKPVEDLCAEGVLRAAAARGR